MGLMKMSNKYDHNRDNMIILWLAQGSLACDCMQKINNFKIALEPFVNV